ncbi:unnamed protein product [Cyprideis torosa]|uniref:Protein zer-1 homolog n=1 Tax=Cyprideis torosa TaxID=163714 RepID=A0A7R8W5U0_9CRUS|nr:unnamed protein product [Cyprideis torosa]CAG0881235.1 unnamed protein product [Cyprideis torosa]
MSEASYALAWENSPQSLLDLGIDFVVKYAIQFLESHPGYDPGPSALEALPIFRAAGCLPIELYERILQHCMKQDISVSDGMIISLLCHSQKVVRRYQAEKSTLQSRKLKRKTVSDDDGGAFDQPCALESSSALHVELPICDSHLPSVRGEGGLVVMSLVNAPLPALTRICLAGSNVSDQGLVLLLISSSKHLHYLNIDRCPKLTGDKFLPVLRELQPPLKCLSLGSFGDGWRFDGIDPFPFPTLTHLTLHWTSFSQPRSLSGLLKPLQALSYLDLSQCVFSSSSCEADEEEGDGERGRREGGSAGAKGVPSLAPITRLPHLTHLVLFDVKMTTGMFSQLFSLNKNLRYLDLSCDKLAPQTYTLADTLLFELVTQLPNLEHLDVSGTNLAGTGSFSNTSIPPPKPGEPKCDIVGLTPRAERPLKFLGLYGCQFDACRRLHIPAQKITGDASEEQIILAAQVYLRRKSMIAKVLNDIFDFVRSNQVTQMKRVLELILRSMERHRGYQNVQISGSASLFYVVRETPRFPPQIRDRVVAALLSGMERFSTDMVMVRNACLTLYNFTLPQDVIFQYERLVRVILRVVSLPVIEEFVQRLAMYILNALGCQVEGKYKLLIGNLGAIETMITLISNRIQQLMCDETLEMAWSILWNVTDETAENCERFLARGGMDQFTACFKAFPDKDDLLRNMMGLLGNVAEVKRLRPRLMISEFVSIFVDLLDSDKDGIEVSYNAAGVLSNLCSDGPHSWLLETPARDDVLKRMVAAISRWDINKDRNINYRSFEPILRLVKVNHTPEVQYWAVWALANLTTKYPKKYCDLVYREGGMEIIRDLLKQGSPLPEVQRLASQILSNCMNILCPRVSSSSSSTVGESWDRDLADMQIRRMSTELPGSGTIKQVEERTLPGLELLAWSPVRDLLAVSFQNGKLSLYRLNLSRVWTKAPPIEGAKVTKLSWRPDGKVLALIYRKETDEEPSSEWLYLLDIASSEINFQRPLSPDVVLGASWSRFKGDRGEQALLDIMQEVWPLPGLPLLSSSFSSSSRGADSSKTSERFLADRHRIRHLDTLYMLVLITRTTSPSGKRVLRVQFVAYGLLLVGSLTVEHDDVEGLESASINLSADFSEISLVTMSSSSFLHRHLPCPLTTQAHDKKFKVEVVIILTRLLSSFKTLMEYAVNSLNLIKKAFETTQLEMEAKLGGNALQRSMEFLELLVLCVPSKMLSDVLIRDLGEKGLRRLALTIEGQLKNMQKCCFLHLKQAALHMCAHLSRAKGMALMSGFQDIGLSTQTVDEALEAAGHFLSKTVEFQSVVASVSGQILTFIRWLQEVVVQHGDETVNSVSQNASAIAALLEDINFDTDNHLFSLIRIGQYFLPEPLKFPLNGSSGNSSSNEESSSINPWLNLPGPIRPAPEKMSLDSAFLNLLKVMDKLFIQVGHQGSATAQKKTPIPSTHSLGPDGTFLYWRETDPLFILSPDSDTPVSVNVAASCGVEDPVTILDARWYRPSKVCVLVRLEEEVRLALLSVSGDGDDGESQKMVARSGPDTPWKLEVNGDRKVVAVWQPNAQVKTLEMELSEMDDEDEMLETV